MIWGSRMQVIMLLLYCPQTMYSYNTCIALAPTVHAVCGYTLRVLLLMAAHMILGITMLAIGVMTHDHDLGDHDLGHRCNDPQHDPGDHDAGHPSSSSRCPRTVYSTAHALHLLLLCMQCVCTHSFSSSLMAAHMILGSRCWPLV